MFGGDENSRKGFVDPRQATETCGFVEQMLSDEILFQITGDPFWGDQCETVAFNSYPAAVMPDFKSLRYLTAPVAANTIIRRVGRTSTAVFGWPRPTTAFAPQCILRAK